MLRLKKTSDNLKVVAPWDPAIDTDKSDMAKYVENLDMVHLKFKDGQDPSIVHLTAFPAWIMTKYYDVYGTKSFRTITSAFRFSIVRIDNLKQHLLTPQVEIEGGDHFEPTDTVEGPHGEKLPCMSEEDAIIYFNRKFHMFVHNIMAVYGFLVPGIEKPYAQLLSSFAPITEKKE